MSFGLVGVMGLRRGVLVPGVEPFEFTSEGSADAAIARTQRIAQKFSGGHLDQWEKIAGLRHPGAWEVKQRPSKRQPKPKEAKP